MQNVKADTPVAKIKKTEQIREISPAGVPIKFGTGPSTSSFASYMQRPEPQSSASTFGS